MKRARALLCGVCLVALTAVPASAQFWFSPDQALPSGSLVPAAFFAADYARGVNSASGKLDFLGAAVGGTFTRVSVMGGLGVVSGGGNSDVTLGAAAGIDLLSAPAAPIKLMLQGGLGYIKMAGVTRIRIPIGLAIKGNIPSPSATITPWVMPRLDIKRASGGGNSDTQLDAGASAGLAVTLPSGLGFHAALDLLLADGGEPLLFGIGAHYMLGR